MAAPNNLPELPAQQLNHPNPFRTGEDEDLLIENQLREKAARIQQEGICFVLEAKRELSEAVPGAADPRPSFLLRVHAILCDESNGQWKLDLNGIRYCLRLLSLHLNLSFIINSSQTADSMNLQAQRALLEAVEARDVGALVNTVRPWEVDMTLMHWTDEAMQYKPEQRERCFAVVHRYYFINVKTEALVRDICLMPPSSDPAGLALFSNNERAYSAALRETTSVLIKSVAKAQRALQVQAAMQHRGGGGGDGGSSGAGSSDDAGDGPGGRTSNSQSILRWSARASYEVTSQALKHIQDQRLYESGRAVRNKWIAHCYREGKSIIDPAKLRVLEASAYDVLRSVYLDVMNRVRSEADVYALAKSGIQMLVLKAHEREFLKVVCALAPHGLVSQHIVRKKRKQHSALELEKTTMTDTSRILNAIILSLLNLRIKAVRNCSVDTATQHQTQTFRVTVAIKGMETIRSEAEAAKNEIVRINSS